MVSLGILSVVLPTEPCALRSTQPLKMSTRDFSWGKGGRCVWLTTYHPCSAETSRKSGALTYLEPLGPPRPVAGHLYFTFFTIPPTCFGHSCGNYQAGSLHRDITNFCGPLHRGKILNSETKCFKISIIVPNTDNFL